MKQIGLRLCALLFFGAMFSNATFVQAGEKVYTFGVVPQFEARKLAAIWVPIFKELETRTGLKFSMEGSPRIPEFEASFQRGLFDFAYMNPYHALIALEGPGYTPLVRDGSRQLFGVLVVKKDGPYKKLSDLEGKTIAFPAPNALGASLLMRAELVRDQKLNFMSLYAQTHTSSYLNVVLGKADAAGGVMSSFKKQKQSIQDNLRILYETRRMAPHPIVAHPRVPGEIAKRVTQAFLEMGQDETARELLSKVPMNKPIPASIEDYQVLKEWGLQDFYVKVSN